MFVCNILLTSLYLRVQFLYFYRDAIFFASRNTTETASSAIEKVKDDVVEWVKDVKETIKK